MALSTRMIRAPLCMTLAAALFAAAPAAAQDAKKIDIGNPGKLGPPLETVKAFEDDFRLVGIGVSAKGRVFATAPSGNVRSHFSMVEVNPKSGALTPYPDAAWNSFNDQADGKSGHDQDRKEQHRRHAELQRKADRGDAEIGPQRIERSAGQIDDLLHPEHELQTCCHQKQHRRVECPAEDNIHKLRHS